LFALYKILRFFRVLAQNLAFVLRICEVYIRIENLSQIASGKALKALRLSLFAEFYASHIGFKSGLASEAILHLL
jgi:hypothetical protein